MGVERGRQGSSGWVGAEQSRRRRALKSQHTTAIGLKEPGHSQMMTPRFRHHTWCVRKRFIGTQSIEPVWPKGPKEWPKLLQPAKHGIFLDTGLHANMYFLISDISRSMRVT